MGTFGHCIFPKCSQRTLHQQGAPCVVGWPAADNRGGEKTVGECTELLKDALEAAEDYLKELAEGGDE